MCIWHQLMLLINATTLKTRMTLSTAHTSAKAADVAKLLLLNKYQATRPPACMWKMAVSPPNHDPNHTLTPTLTSRD